MKRNEGKETSADVVKLNILTKLLLVGATSNGKGAIKSQLGYWGFPDYSFRWPQGAAFAVAKIVRELLDDGLITNYPSRSYYISHKGIQSLRQLQVAIEKAQTV